MCARHIYANWTKKWRGQDRKKAFQACAKSTYPQQLKENLKLLGTMGEGIVEDALEYHMTTWCKVFFKLYIKCDVVDNNMSKTVNSWIMFYFHV